MLSTGHLGEEVMDLHIAAIPRLQTASFSTMVLGLSIEYMVRAIHRAITVHSLQDFTAKNLVLTLISLLVRIKLPYMCQSPTHTERCKYFKCFDDDLFSHNIKIPPTSKEPIVNIYSSKYWDRLQLGGLKTLQRANRVMKLLGEY